MATKKNTFRINGHRGVRFFSSASRLAYDSYVADKLFYHTRMQNDLGASFTNIERKKNHIIKRAEPRGEEKLIQEIEWILKLSRTHFKNFLPKIYNYSLKKGDVFYEMKYYSCPNLRKVIIEDMNPTATLKTRWQVIIKAIFIDLTKKNDSVIPDADFFNKTHYSKFKRRMEVTKKEAPWLVPALEAPVIYVNGMPCINPFELMEKINTDPKIIDALTPPLLYMSHGDIHCNNILCGISPTNVIFLDCRGKSPDGTSFFDPAYDIAKLYHDLRSYYSLIEKQFYNINFSTNSNIPHIEYYFTDTTLTERFSKHYFYVRELVEKKIGFDKDINFRADFTEAMHFLTMIPLHVRIKDESIICYATGIIRLNNWVKRYYPSIYYNLMEKYNPKQAKNNPQETSDKPTSEKQEPKK